MRPVAAGATPPADVAPNGPCQNPLAVERRGRLSGFARPWAGLGARRVRTRRGRQGVGPEGGGRGFPLSGDLRGAAEPRAGTAPLLSPSWGAGLSLGPWGAVGVGLVRRAAGARTPWPRTARKRRPRRLGLQSSPPPPPSRLGSLPFLAPAAAPPPPPPSSPWLSASRSRASRGAARAGRRGAAARRRGEGGGEPPASPALAASGGRAGRSVRGRRARPRPARAEPFVPSQKFACRDRNSCGRGGRRGRGAGGGGE